MERLHKFIAKCGVCSRRAAEKLIEEGRVSVNGEVITAMGVQVGPDDIVEVDGDVLKTPRLMTLILHKPKGVVTTLSDPQRRPTIVRYLPETGLAMKPVGRLDMDTTGLIICTNDGELASRLAHPRYGIEKEYLVKVKGEMTEKTADKLRKGVFLEGRKTSEAKVFIQSYDRNRDVTTLTMIIHEGRNRQVRNMCEIVGHFVQELTRVRIGFLYLRGLSSGRTRVLSKPEVDRLRNLVELS